MISKPYELNELLRVAFDVDGTLIHQVGKGVDVPRYDIITLYKFLQSKDCRMIVWSGSGKDYAMIWGEKLGLLPFTVMDKGAIVPDMVFDDEDVTLGKINIKV